MGSSRMSTLITLMATSSRLTNCHTLRATIDSPVDFAGEAFTEYILMPVLIVPNLQSSILLMYFGFLAYRISQHFIDKYILLLEFLIIFKLPCFFCSFSVCTHLGIFGSATKRMIWWSRITTLEARLGEFIIQSDRSEQLISVFNINHSMLKA